MANQTTKKCAHVPCLCDVPKGEEYCGESCRDGGSEHLEIACQCDHSACPLTARQFVFYSAEELANL
jgi:hypothetical protein